MRKDTQAKQTQSDFVTVTLTVAKMEAAGASADISHNGDLHLSLPAMSDKQRNQLNGAWESFRHHLQDINTAQSVTDAVLEAATQTHRKETNARIIANLL